MRDQEIVGLMEAYSSIYTPQEKLTEEVQIAAQYFCEMGLNEDGVDILIEELGLDEFVDFVYDISEEYVLTEARAGGVKIEPKTAKGKEIKGKPTAASLKRLRAQKAERKAGEEKASQEKPSGMKASLQRQSAVANAKEKQPKKKGVLDRVAGAINKGIERHNAAMSAAKETGKTIRKAAGKIGGVAKEVGKGASGAAKLAGHVASKGLGEEVDIYDMVLSYLLDEGYAETPEEAEAIMVNMDDEWRQSILDEAERPIYSRGGEQRRTQTALQVLGKHATARDKKTKHNIPKGGTTISDRDPEGKRLFTGDQDRGKGNKAARRAAALKSNKPEPKKSFPNRLRRADGQGIRDSYDYYDIVLSHLIDEGYADTEESAAAIMVNMSEEWMQSIMEREMDEPGESDDSPDVKAHNRAVKYRPRPRRPRIEDDPRYGTPRDKGGNWKY